MEDFWKSVQTIQAERGADYRAFPLFGAVHWAELLVAIAIVVLCYDLSPMQGNDTAADPSSCFCPDAS